MKKVLAITKDGKMTFCTAPEDQRGRGRCNHIAHKMDNESTQNFIDRINVILLEKERTDPELVDIVYLKEGLNKLDRMMIDEGVEPLTIKVIGGFCTYSITNESTRDIDSITKLDTNMKDMIHLIAKESDGKLEHDWLKDDAAYVESGNHMIKSVEEYLFLHPEEFKNDESSDLSKLQRIKIKKASNDAMICMKYAAIKSKMKAKDVNDLSALIKSRMYNLKDLQRTLNRFGINVEMSDLASDLYMIGIIKTEEEYLSLINDM